MGLFNIFKKEKNSLVNDLLSLPCDYDGYDLVFESGVTNPKLYSDITDIITNNKLSINDVEEYNELSINSSSDDFYDFYDAWIEKLLTNGFVINLSNDVDIRQFSNKINNLLICKGESIRINVDSIVERYNSEIIKYTFNGKEIPNNFNYDILEANIVADELRKYGYELICFFSGFDNDIKTIIKIDEIEKMKDIESKIK